MVASNMSLSAVASQHLVMALPRMELLASSVYAVVLVRAAAPAATIIAVPTDNFIVNVVLLILESFWLSRLGGRRRRLARLEQEWPCTE